MINALELADKVIEDAKIVCLGAGAAAIACMKLLVSMGAKAENIFMLDRKGVIHAGRDDLNEYKAIFATETDKRTLTDALKGADVFVGLSGPNLLPPADLKLMAENPIVFACSNPDPEIDPAAAHASRPDVIMATGRSDYPNQVNNVLGFPFIFRGALDVRATAINEEMKIAAVHAIRELAKEPVPEYISQAYGGIKLEFGREYIIPKPMDVRLIEKVPAAVAQAAVPGALPAQVGRRLHLNGIALNEKTRFGGFFCVRSAGSIQIDHYLALQQIRTQQRAGRRLALQQSAGQDRFQLMTEGAGHGAGTKAAVVAFASQIVPKRGAEQQLYLMAYQALVELF